MSPTVFAVVDLVLLASWNEAKAASKMRLAYGHRYLAANAIIYAEQMCQHVGWWRSTWVRP